MKTGIKISLLTVLLALLSSQQVKAVGPLDAGFTIRFAYLMPSSTFGKMNETNFYRLETADPGYGFALGSMIRCLTL